MALGDYLAIVRKWWWLLLASTIVAAASGYFAVSRTPRIYEATTTVIVGQSLSKTDPTYQDFTIGQQLAQTYVNLVNRQSILQGAADALELGFVPWSGNVSAAIVPGTQLVEIRVRDTSPERARALADAIAQQLILQTPEDPLDNQTRRSFVQDQLQSLEQNIESTEAAIEEEQRVLNAANSARAIQQSQSNITALQQRLASYQANYASLLQTLGGGANYISVIEPAATPTQPVSPNVRSTVMLAAAIGLALSAGGAFLIEFLDDTLKTPDDVARSVHLPTVGAISRIAGDQYPELLITAYSSQDPVAEAFRALRTNIRYLAINRQLRTLLVTSAAPVEGKSIVLANLAMVMAQSGYRVFLVDADMRRPVQHRIFSLNNHFGLSDALLEATPDLAPYSHDIQLQALADAAMDAKSEPSVQQLSAAVVTEEREAPTAPAPTSPAPLMIGNGHLHVITAGTPPPNPADLLGSERMRALIEALEGQADIVLIDTPPVLAVADAIALTSLTDGVLLVADAGRTRRTAARQAVEKLRQVDANVLGVILNRVSPAGSGYGMYGYYARPEHQPGKEARSTLWGRLGISSPMEAMGALRRKTSKAEPAVTDDGSDPV